MSKNPTVLEGGIARVFSGIRKLFTRQSGSDDMITWVPESDRQLGTKYITQNGVYLASDDGYYAFSSVTVSVPTNTGVTGEGEDGEQHYVAPDPDTGELVDEVIPSSIVVETPPTNQYGIYKDGQAIEKDGMVVKAYLASGELYTGLPDGIVPNEQITLVPATSAYDENTYQSGAYVSDLETKYDMPIPSGGATVIWVNQSTGQTYEVNYEIHSGYTGGFVQQADIGGSLVRFVSAKEGSSWYPSGESRGIDTIGTGYRPPVNGAVIQSVVGAVATHQPGASTDDANAALWTLIYGEKVQGAGSVQAITAEWPRTGDGATLSDTFEILVAPPIYGGGEA